MKTNPFHITTYVLLLLFLAVPLFAAPVPPEAGLKAEMAGDWEQALTVYQQELEAAPERIDLWVRVANIQSHLKRPHDAVMSLLTAIELQPHDAQLYKRLSEAHASNNQAEAALLACREALFRSLDDLDVRRACAQLAVWTGDYDQAEWHYTQSLAADPEKAEALLGVARINTWSGKYGKGLKAYRAYLDKQPGDKDVWLELAQALIWKGDYAGAQKTLDHYLVVFGNDDNLQARQARLLVRAGRPDAANALNEPLLAASPNDYYLRLTRTLILRDNHEPRAARDSLSDLERLQPHSRDTQDMKRFVLTPQRSNLEARFYFSEDSDNIRILRSELLATAQLAPEFSLRAGGSWERLKADLGSGLDTIDGSGAIEDSAGWLGFGYRVAPMLGIDGLVGGGSVQGGDSYSLFQVGVDLDPHDRFSAHLQYDRKLYNVSPRSVSLGILSNGGSAFFVWRPTLRTSVIAQGSYADLSDDNTRWEAIFSPRYAVMRTAHFNLDLGLLGWWLGFDQDLDNGYYDPELYERYAAIGIGTWKISDDDSVSLVVSLGEQRDTFGDSFDFGADANLEGVFGLYRDWMVKAAVGYTDRSRSSGAYDAWLGFLSLMRRF